MKYQKRKTKTWKRKIQNENEKRKPKIEKRKAKNESKWVSECVSVQVCEFVSVCVCKCVSVSVKMWVCDTLFWVNVVKLLSRYGYFVEYRDWLLVDENDESSEWKKLTEEERRKKAIIK